MKAGIMAKDAIARLQRQSQGYVVPDSFTHGSSQQRTRWFMSGLKLGMIDGRDTFDAERM